MTSSGRSTISLRSSSIPTERKKRPSRIERNGSTSLSSSWRYGDSARTTPATKAPSAVESPKWLITAAAPMTANKPATTNSSRSPKRPIKRKSGLRTSRPNSDQSDDGDHRKERQLPSRRRARVRRHARHRADDRDQRYDGEVLEKQDRESALALRRVQLIVRAQHRKDLRGRGQRQRQADRERRFGRQVEREIDQGAKRESAHQHLRETQTENVVAKPPEPAWPKLQADDEEQKRDADLGDAAPPRPP